MSRGLRTIVAPIGRRLALRFGLRSLLLVMLVASVALTVWVRLVRPYSEQATAVAWLERLGAEVTSRPAPGSAWRRVVVEMMAGKDAYCHTTAVRVAGVELPEPTPDRLAALPWLVSLRLDHTTFSGENAACLARLDRLETLSVRYTPFDDAGAAIVADLPNLRELRITGTGVTDAGLASLAAAPRLKELYARWSATTAEGAEAFRLANSACRLHAHQLPQ